MNDKVIQRIDGALKQINGIQDKIDGVSFEEFLNDSMIMDIISFRLIQLGEKMIKLEQLLKGKYPELPWYQARIMRNIIVHDYGEMDLTIVYDTVIHGIPDMYDLFMGIAHE